MKDELYKFNFISFEEARYQLSCAKSSYYVYVLGKPDRTPFYVGKGIRQRVLQHEVEARQTPLLSHKLNSIRKVHRQKQQILYALAGFFSNEKEALQFERSLIQSIGRYDLGTGSLTNQTDGGEDIFNPSEESLKSSKRRIVWQSIETCTIKLSLASNNFYQ